MRTKYLFLVNKPFIWCVMLIIFLAYLHPEIGAKGGLLKPEIVVKYIAVIIIFLVSGLSLQNEELAAASCQYHLHGFIQGFSLLFTPLVIQLFLLLFEEFYFDADLMKGFVTVSCMPPPVSSAVILTKEVGGNEAGAVFNSAFGSFLGIFVTPALLFIFLGSSTSMPVLNAFFHLSITIIMPVIVGQFLRAFIGSSMQKYKQQLSITSKVMLLLIIYGAFCDSFIEKSSFLTLSTIWLTIVIVVLVQSLLMAIVFVVTRYFERQFSPEDTIAAMFCGTHKSLTLGFPILKMLYDDNPKFLLISFPLLVYHPTQILYGSLLIPFLQAWLRAAQNRKKRWKMHPI